MSTFRLMSKRIPPNFFTSMASASFVSLNKKTYQNTHCQASPVNKEDKPHNNEFSLDNLIEQSKNFSTSPLLDEVLGIKQITKTTTRKQFLEQILSRELGTMIKIKTRYLSKEKQNKIIADIFDDIDKAVALDPVDPTPFQVAVTFNGTKALMAHRFAHQLWQDNRTEDALSLSDAALSNYHVNIHPSAKIESGVFIDHAFGVSIKENAQIGSGTYIFHKAKIGANVQIGQNAQIGAGAKISHDVKIGDNAVIGAGTLVIANVPNNHTALGLYTGSGSSKIVPTERSFKMPEEMKQFLETVLLSSENTSKKQDNDEKYHKILSDIVNLIPFNPNSSLTIKNLANFYHKVKKNQKENSLESDDIVLMSYHIAHAALQESLNDEHSEDTKKSFGNFALWLQGRMATVFKVDIHPAARLDDTVMFPKEITKGIVIGATAIVKENTYISDGVTLGGNGKDRGDRHPKIDKNCYIGEDVTILGGGTLGAGSVVMPNSVLRLPKNSKTPQNRVYAGKPAIDMTQTCKENTICDKFLRELDKE